MSYIRDFNRIFKRYYMCDHCGKLYDGYFESIDHRIDGKNWHDYIILDVQEIEI